MSNPATLPELFVDRSLGRIQVPQILRAAGLTLTTLAEHYGVPADEKVADVTWLGEATDRGWVCLMKDSAIVIDEAERATVLSVGARCFGLASQSLPAAVMAGWYLAALPEIAHIVATETAPYVYAVERGRLRKRI